MKCVNGIESIPLAEQIRRKESTILNKGKKIWPIPKSQYHIILGLFQISDGILRWFITTGRWFITTGRWFYHHWGDDFITTGEMILSPLGDDFITTGRWFITTGGMIYHHWGDDLSPLGGWFITTGDDLSPLRDDLSPLGDDLSPLWMYWAGVVLVI